jgi:cation diffusion facilitator CzcD-associated flavoprotein CzcO
MAPGMGDLSAKDRSKYVEKNGAGSVYLSQEKVKAKVVVSCVGGLVEPKAWPENIPGNEEFNGKIFHSARWNEDLDLTGKDVVVVGTGCSAAQVVPTILKEPYRVKSVTQLMRSPPYCVPKVEEPGGKEWYAKNAPTIMHYAPFLGWILREAMALAAEVAWFRIFQDTPSNERNRKQLEIEMNARMRSIAPEKYHKMLTPDYGIGCKRRIFDAEWYKSMKNPKFRLSTQNLSKVSPEGIVVGPGRAYPPMSVEDENAPTNEEEIKADIIILANGFDTVEFLHPLTVKGKGGRDMHDVWRSRGGSQAYLGTAMDGFPNFFMIFGPNTVTGHSSVIMASENMVELTLKMIEPVLKGDASTVEVKKEAEQRYTNDVQQQLKKTVFTAGGCANWYVDPKTGWNSNAYPWSQIDFWYRCTFPKWNDWSYSYTTRGMLKKRAAQATKTILLAATIVGIYRARKMGTSLTAAIKQYMRWTAATGLNLLSTGVKRLQDMVVG